MNRFKRYLTASAVSLLFPLSVIAGPVNVNTADAETISAELQGVGLSKARAIVEYMEKNGPFNAAAELAEVKGIGARTLEINKDNILTRPESKKSK